MGCHKDKKDLGRLWKGAERLNIYDIEDMSFAYPDTNDNTGTTYLEPALSDITLSFSEGEFVLIAGSSGCGKTTLMRHLKGSVAPKGKLSGQILFNGCDICRLSGEETASKIGFVWQDVNAQLLTDKVWHELAFGLESLGYDNSYIRRRVAEMSAFFGIDKLMDREVRTLSGGQKQLVNLASVMALSPEVLLLDEPTSQLDPIAANEFIGSLVRINRELGTTIIMTEHRIEEVLPICTRVVVMKDGRVTGQGSVSDMALAAEADGCINGMYPWGSAAVNIYLGLKGKGQKKPDCLPESFGPVPVSVAEGRGWLREFDRKYRESGKEKKELSDMAVDDRKAAKKKKVCSLDEVHFRYDRDGEDVLSGLTLDIYDGEILMINGSNGCGKSTLLSMIAGAIKPYRGRRRLAEGKKVCMLPQNPEILFTRTSVREELRAYLVGENEDRVVDFCRLRALMDRHPYDLSGGEKQMLALAMLLCKSPDILLLDEPTKGLDSYFKASLCSMLKSLKAQGKTIVIVSHDIEFCAMTGERVALLFGGEVATVCQVREYMLGNHFFTTAAARIAKDIVPGAVTVPQILYAYNADEYTNADKCMYTGGDVHGDTQADEYIGANKEKKKKDKQTSSDNNEEDKDAVSKMKQDSSALMWWQKLIMIVTIPVIAFCICITVSRTSLTELVGSGRTVTKVGWQYIAVCGLFVAATVSLLVAIRPFARQKNEAILMRKQKKGSDKRTLICIALLMLMVSATIWFGCQVLNDRKYYFISLLIIVEAMVVFLVSFEKKGVRLRDIVILSVMCAIAAAGRAAFFMLPSFCPVLAVVIISGVAFGAEGGFVVGALSMFVSNFIMGQGPWTPWQMFAMGLVGLLSGLFFARKGAGVRPMTKLGLCIFGCLMCVLVYGGIMNPASVITWQPNVNLSMIIASYVTGFPFDVVHGVSTVLFLWILAKPFLEKLDRVRIKYGVL